ncbi:class I SAM-dependent methyltransferase [Bizionia paragorgiae]|uniref:class I SAM-dependent methyltransferase n=1 Tax=Bizionia paragorgiae TaxID=283786 RepID=UPI003A8FC2B0
MILFPETSLDESHSLNSFEKSLLLHILATSQPRIILELGVYKGITTKFICEWLQQYKIEAKIVGFDLSEVLNQLVLQDREIADLEKSGRIKFEAGYLPGTLDNFLKNHNGMIDFVLIDAQHDYTSVFGELKRIWPYLSEGGYIICHDYHKPRIQYAIEKFSRISKAQYLPLLSNPSQSIVYSSLVILTKPKLKFNWFKWFVHHFRVKQMRGYYLLKKPFTKFFNSID